MTSKHVNEGDATLARPWDQVERHKKSSLFLLLITEWGHGNVPHFNGHRRDAQGLPIALGVSPLRGV